MQMEFIVICFEFILRILHTFDHILFQDIYHFWLFIKIPLKQMIYWSVFVRTFRGMKKIKFLNFQSLKLMTIIII